MNIPSADTFDAHGLYDIDVDLSGTRDLGQSATGWATYRPSPDSPLLDKELEDEYSGRTVKFYWCSTDKPEAARTFRRCCQIWAIETLARKDDDEKTAVEPKGILGWWEQDGLWMIAHEPKVETVSLAQWWAARLAEQQPDVDGPSDTQDEVYKRDSRGMIYADACDLFVSLSRCNQVSWTAVWPVNVTLSNSDYIENTSSCFQLGSPRMAFYLGHPPRSSFAAGPISSPWPNCRFLASSAGLRLKARRCFRSVPSIAQTDWMMRGSSNSCVILRQRSLAAASSTLCRTSLRSALSCTRS